jgi:hypothetical protein
VPYEDELPLTAKAEADGRTSAAARPITEIVLNIGLLLSAKPNGHDACLFPPVLLIQRQQGLRAIPAGGANCGPYNPQNYCLEDGAVAAFASDASPPGVVAPFASEPLPVEPVFAFMPFVGPLPASFVDVAPLVGPLPASAFGCANAGNERPPATTAATKTVLNEDMKNSIKRRSASQLGWVAQVPPR